MNERCRTMTILSGIMAVCLLVFSFSLIFIVRNPVVSTLIVSLNLSFAADMPIIESNWTSHPRILEVRDIYHDIREAMDSGNLDIEVREFEYCEPYEDTLRAIYRTKDGTVQVYKYEGGSDDSALKLEFYYDRGGVLRFVFITGGAFNGTRIEHRIYFDGNGKRIWEMQKLIAGPGYTFPHEWPREALVFEPLKVFSALSPCPEHNSGP